MTDNTEPTIDEMDKIFDTVLDDKKCVADHNDFGGDVIITWTGVWCENCEKPIGDVLPLRDLLSDEKIAQLKALISDQVAKARIDELIGVRGWTEYEPDPKYSPAERFHIVPYTYLTNRIAELNGVKE